MARAPGPEILNAPRGKNRDILFNLGPRTGQNRLKFLELELELELIQTQMAQKPVLRAKVYAHAMRASQNRKKEVRREKEV